MAESPPVIPPPVPELDGDGAATERLTAASLLRPNQSKSTSPNPTFRTSETPKRDRYLRLSIGTTMEYLEISALTCRVTVQHPAPLRLAASRAFVQCGSCVQIGNRYEREHTSSTVLLWWASNASRCQAVFVASLNWSDGPSCISQAARRACHVCSQPSLEA